MKSAKETLDNLLGWKDAVLPEPPETISYENCINFMEFYASQTDDSVDFLVPYCNICSACGEEGCCSPLKCKQHPDGDYCEAYLTDLKFAYDFYQKISGYLCSTTTENNNKFNELFDELYTKHYENIT